MCIVTIFSIQFSDVTSWIASHSLCSSLSRTFSPPQTDTPLPQNTDAPAPPPGRAPSTPFRPCERDGSVSLVQGDSCRIRPGLFRSQDVLHVHHVGAGVRTPFCPLHPNTRSGHILWCGHADRTVCSFFSLPCLGRCDLCGSEHSCTRLLWSPPSALVDTHREVECLGPHFLLGFYMCMLLK